MIKVGDAPSLPDTQETRFCKDCKWIKLDNSWLWFAFIPFFWRSIQRERLEYSKCYNPDLPWDARRMRKEEVNLVSGEEKLPIMMYCKHARCYSDECGPEAKYFEPKA